MKLFAILYDAFWKEKFKMAGKNPPGVFLPVKNLHFIKEPKGVVLSARCGKLSAKKISQLIRFLERLPHHS